MAKNSPATLKNKTIYEIYVRNHTRTGTFKDIFNDLLRIKDLGVDIIWFMPIHPIGQLNKKGTLGCPYSISDYTKINPEYGTEEDFKELIETIHSMEIDVMIDVVYNHTSHDNIYKKEHPDYYYKTKEGNYGNKIADWSDIIDLDYNNPELWQSQIDALKKWASLGVDGFRCDVAPIVPMEFWAEARKQLEEINPDILLLAETVEPHFLESVRNAGIPMASDSETYQVFDICYDYDTYGEFSNYLRGKCTLDHFLTRKRLQEAIYPDNYVKLRYLENHDIPRAKKLIPNDSLLATWTSFMFFEKGAALLYSGQEVKAEQQPSLFDKDPINWSSVDKPFISLIQRLSQLKKEPIFATGRYMIHQANVDGVIFATYATSTEVLYGIFNVGSKTGLLNVSIDDNNYLPIPALKNGNYKNLITDDYVKIENQEFPLSEQACIFRVEY